MNKLFKPKCINRIVVFLALLAPIIYLFGTMGTALCGANGTQLFADSPFSEISLYGEFEMTKNLGFDLSTGQLVSSDDWHFASPLFIEIPTDINYFVVTYTPQETAYLRIFKYSEDYSFLGYDQSYGTSDHNFVPDGCFYIRLSVYYPSLMVDSSSVSLYVENPYDSPSISASYYSDYLFGQMFPRDNFLAKVGQNALSDNPMGFAPFGWLLSYLDQNMLHMGASQLAQMGYGYFYWCAHVLLLDLVFYFAVFFIRFIKHVGDMFIKEE